MISSAEAFLIFDKWRAESRFLYVFTATPSGESKRFQAIVREVLMNSERLRLLAERSDGGSLPIEIDLAGAKFKYADTRELDDPELGKTAWVCFVTVFLASEGSIMFAERK